MRSVRTITSLAVALAGVIALAGTAHALEAEKWDQKDVTDLVNELATSVDKLLNQAKLEIRETTYSSKSVENYLLVEDLKSFKRHSRALFKHLEKGASREETAGLFRRIGVIVRDTELQKSQSSLLEGSRVEIESALKIVEQISAFYIEPQPPVAAPPPE